jgi:hypothetical protein
MADIFILTLVYKPTYNWGAPHCIGGLSHDFSEVQPLQSWVEARHWKTGKTTSSRHHFLLLQLEKQVTSTLW